MIPNNRAFNGKSYYEFNGKRIFRYQDIQMTGDFELKIKFISVDSPHKQGVALSFFGKPRFVGDVFLNGKRFERHRIKEPYYVFEEGVFQDNEFTLRIHIENGGVAISNASDIVGDYPGLAEKLSSFTGREHGEIKSFTSGFTAVTLYGNAFWYERISENRYRYYCNDHTLDDDFDDLIFEMEINRID